jgi:hypothetical protein
MSHALLQSVEMGDGGNKPGEGRQKKDVPKAKKLKPKLKPKAKQAKQTATPATQRIKQEETGGEDVWEDQHQGLDVMETDHPPAGRQTGGGSQSESGEDVPVNEATSSDDERVQRVLSRVTRMDLKDGQNGQWGRRHSRPINVQFDGPVLRNVTDIDTLENQKKRNHCARLFNGEVDYGEDSDGIPECMLFHFPSLLPLDREKVLKFKKKDQRRRKREALERDGRAIPLDLHSNESSDSDAEDNQEAKRRNVECCTPADLKGLSCGKLRLHRSGKVTMKVGDVVFDVSEGTDVIDRQDLYWMVGESSKDDYGRLCDLSMYPMATVKHRVVVTPRIDELL